VRSRTNRRRTPVRRSRLRRDRPQRNVLRLLRLASVRRSILRLQRKRARQRRRSIRKRLPSRKSRRSKRNRRVIKGRRPRFGSQRASEAFGRLFCRLLCPTPKSIDATARCETSLPARSVQRSLYVPRNKGLRKVLACVSGFKDDVPWQFATD
jgi:hypothetical protein